METLAAATVLQSSSCTGPPKGSSVAASTALTAPPPSQPAWTPQPASSPTPRISAPDPPPRAFISLLAVSGKITAVVSWWLACAAEHASHAGLPPPPPSETAATASPRSGSCSRSNSRQARSYGSLLQDWCWKVGVRRGEGPAAGAGAWKAGQGYYAVVLDGVATLSRIALQEIWTKLLTHRQQQERLRHCIASQCHSIDNHFLKNST